MAKKGNETTEVTVKPAKGRPMLQWVGKKPTTVAVKLVDMLGEEILVTKDV
jgi:hypothetical protein